MAQPGSGKMGNSGRKGISSSDPESQVVMVLQAVGAGDTIQQDLLILKTTYRHGWGDIQ
ncbi:hypothetical protein M3J09_003980 [Ascochyta lentis]